MQNKPFITLGAVPVVFAVVRSVSVFLLATVGGVVDAVAVITDNVLFSCLSSEGNSVVEESVVVVVVDVVCRSVVLVIIVVVVGVVVVVVVVVVITTQVLSASFT